MFSIQHKFSQVCAGYFIRYVPKSSRQQVTLISVRKGRNVF